MIEQIIKANIDLLPSRSRRKYSLLIAEDMGFKNIERFYGYIESLNKSSPQVGILKLNCVSSEPRALSCNGKLCISGREFTRKLIHSISNNCFESFRNELVNLEELAIVDIEQIKNLPATMDALIDIVRQRRFTLFTARRSREEILSDQSISEDLKYLLGR